MAEGEVPGGGRGAGEGTGGGKGEGRGAGQGNGKGREGGGATGRRHSGRREGACKCVAVAVAASREIEYDVQCDAMHVVYCVNDDAVHLRGWTEASWQVQTRHSCGIDPGIGGTLRRASSTSAACHQLVNTSDVENSASPSQLVKRQGAYRGWRWPALPAEGGWDQGSSPGLDRWIE